MNCTEGLNHFRQFPAAGYISLAFPLVEYASDAILHTDVHRDITGRNVASRHRGKLSDVEESVSF